MEKIKYLDGLRGLAAFVVVLHHFAFSFYPSSLTGDIYGLHTESAIEIFISQNPVNILINGNFAVCIFFVLSGYVLSYRYFKFKDHEIIVSGIIRRYFRLVIPAAFTVFIFFLMLKFLSLNYLKINNQQMGNWWLFNIWVIKPDPWEMFKEAFIGVFFKYQTNYVGVLWTMSYELYGSFLVFSLLSLFGNFRKRYLIYIPLLIFFYQSYYLAFVLGVIISDLKNSEINYLNYLNSRLINYFLLVIGLFFGSYPANRSVNDTIYAFFEIQQLDSTANFIHIVASAFILLVVLNSVTIQKFFSNKYLVYLGKISFSLYLMHMLIIASLSNYLLILLTSTYSYHLSFIITFYLSLLVIFGISHLVNKYVDEKGIKLSKFIYKKFFVNNFCPEKIL